jgi:hypothetical protein
MMFKHANIREASCVDEARGKAERAASWKTAWAHKGEEHE